MTTVWQQCFADSTIYPPMFFCALTALFEVSDFDMYAGSLWTTGFTVVANCRHSNPKSETSDSGY